MLFKIAHPLPLPLIVGSYDEGCVPLVKADVWTASEFSLFLELSARELLWLELSEFVLSVLKDVSVWNRISDCR